MRIDEGQTTNFSESPLVDELAVIDVTDPTLDRVVAVPARLLVPRKSVQHPSLPFRIETKTFHRNSSLSARITLAGPAADAASTRGFGTQLAVKEEPVATAPDTRNLPTAVIELITPEGSLGTWVVSVQLAQAQTIEYGGRTWSLSLRPQRHYKPYALTLLKFNHDKYPGTEIPRNFSSRLRLTTPDGSEDREVVISMNNPLRYAGLAFYRAGFSNEDRTSVLQVVRNPGWLIPYLASGLVSLGLLVQFGLQLFKPRSRAASPAPAPALP